jgi:hypothetical protein
MLLLERTIRNITDIMSHDDDMNNQNI